MTYYTKYGALIRKQETYAKKAVNSVLHVDDDKLQRIVLSKILKNCEVVAIVSVNDGSKGLETMKKNEFDMVISDLEMPNMDGIVMIKAFRAWESEKGRTKRQHAVCLTGAEERVSDEELLEAGFDEVVRKPITKDKIDALLQRASHRL